MDGQDPPSFPTPSLVSSSPPWISSFFVQNNVCDVSSSRSSDATKQKETFPSPEMVTEEAQSPSVDEHKERSTARTTKAKKASKPRFTFHTRSQNDILDDGYRWRKYGQKSVKNCSYPRSYYRCTQHTCEVKKQVQRLSKETSIVETTYEGIHNHPCEKLMQTLTPLLDQIHFLSTFTKSTFH